MLSEILTFLYCLWLRRPQFVFSDDDDEKRVVRSLKDKRLPYIRFVSWALTFPVCTVSFRYDELRDVIRVLKNSQNIKDVAKVLSGQLADFQVVHWWILPPPWIEGFETLQKAFIKAKGVVEKEGGIPTFYIRALVGIEDFVSQVSGEPWMCR